MTAMESHARPTEPRFGLLSLLTTLLLGLSMLLATPALAHDASPLDFEGYPGVPVYRLWDPSDGEFMFTTSDEECVDLQYQDGWVYDGIAFYTAPSDGQGTESVYRLTSTAANATPSHLWTADYNEYVALQGPAWTGDGVAWYASGATPVYQLSDASTGLDCYTTSQDVLDLLGAGAPWSNEGAAFNAVAPGTDATPKIVGSLDLSAKAVEAEVGDAATAISVSNVTPGTLSAWSEDEAVATVRVDGTSVLVQPVAAGTATVKVQRSAAGFYPAEIAAVNVTVAGEDTPTDVPNVSIWRLYNPYTREHLFTPQRFEYDQLGAQGWQQEGVAWVAPGSSSVPVYRLHNPYAQDHHYTTDLNEYQGLMAQGWEGEGEYWYSDTSQRVPVYRIFNPYETGAGSHQFTTDTNEYENLKNAGWQDEKIGWYGVEKGQPVAPPTPTPPTPSEPSTPGGDTGEGGSGGGTSQPSNPEAEPFYWINTKSKIIHGDSCPSLGNANLSLSHWKRVDTPAEAAAYLSQGYAKCKNCRPTGI